MQGGKLRKCKLISWILAARIMLAAYWKKATMPTYMEWFNRTWYMVLMYNISIILKTRDRDVKAKAKFQERRTIFLDYWATVSNKKYNAITVVRVGLSIDMMFKLCLWIMDMY